MRSPQKSPLGAILVLTLLLITLLAAVTLAFFSSATLTSQIAGSSSASLQSSQIARTGLATTVADLIAEARSGSTVINYSGWEELVPRNATSTNAPTTVPFQMTNNPGISNLLKGSYGGVAAWQNSLGSTNYSTNGPVRAFASASNLTTTPSRNGRWVRAGRWAAPRLHDNDAQITGPNFTPPSWVLVTRDGGAAMAAGPGFLPAWGDRSSPSNVVGRYAAMVYDVGGLANINVAGHMSPDVPAVRAAQGGRVAFSDLAGLVSSPAGNGTIDKAALIGWRNAGSLSSGNYAVLLDDPVSDFRLAKVGDQLFPTRQDLIRATDPVKGLASGSAVPPDMLSKLTVFSRARNAPSWRPDPARPKVNRSGSAGPDDDMNPSPLGIRVTKTFTRRDGSTAKVGEPLMKTRFPLGKLALIQSPSSSVTAAQTLADILSYFGLQPAADGYGWEYAHAPNFIAKLKDLPALGREPDFFEMLQAAILTGSLGAYTGNPPPATDGDTATRCKAVDGNVFYQIMQIGADLIDQYDVDDFATTLVFNGTSFYGIENLPYIYAMPVHIIRPAAGYWGQNPGRDLVMGWYQFGLWNPHQNAVLPTPQNLRIRSISGGAGLRLVDKAGVQQQQAPFRDFAANPAELQFQNERKFGELTFLDRPPMSDPDTVNGMDTYEAAATSGDPNNLPPTMPKFGNDKRPGFAGIYVGSVSAPEAPTYVDGNGTTQITLDKGGYDEARWITAYIDSKPANPPVFQLEQQVSGVWRPYQVVDGVVASVAGTNSGLWGTGSRAFFQFMNLTGLNIRPMLGYFGIASIDPRTLRFGMAYYGNLRQLSRWRVQPGSTLASVGTTGSETQEQKFLAPAVYASPPRPSGPRWHAVGGSYPFRLADNVTTGSLSMWVDDPDGVTRPGDGNSASRCFPGLFTDTGVTVAAYQTALSTGTFPSLFTAPLDTNYISHRSVILNRPFRNVGELGYAFRGQPWKTLDFSSTQSADLALLDFFAIDEAEIVAGPVNLNTPHADVLASVLSGLQAREMLAKTLSPAPSGAATSEATLTAANANLVANAIVTRSASAPLRNLGDLVTFLAGQSPPPPITAGNPIVKTVRESPVRALSGSTQTRVWNVLIDVIAQAGIFPPGSADFNNFVVRGETRYWLHAAIDRYTGEVVDYQMETVTE